MKRFYLAESTESYEDKILDNLVMRETPLGFISVKNAIVLPHRKDYSNTVWGKGGVIDQSGEYVKESFYRNGWVTFGGYYDYDGKVNVINGSAIYLGYFFKHWGHFLKDIINRMWIILEHYHNEYVVYVGDDDISGNYLEFMKMLGVPEDKLIRIDKATKFSEIIIPELSYVITEYYSKEYLDIFDRVRENCLSVYSQNQSEYKNKKIYFTRVAFSQGKRAKEFGEESIKKTFELNGYKILRPETLSLCEQIYIWNNAETIACINGTIPMNLLFSNGQVKVIVLNKTCNKHLNLLLIEKIKNIFVTYVDIYDTKHTNKKFSLGTGPFLMRITNSFTAFCKDSGYELSYENKGKVFLNLIKFKLIVLKNLMKPTLIRLKRLIKK